MNFLFEIGPIESALESVVLTVDKHYIVSNEHREIAAVRFESRDLASLETAMKINKQCGLMFGNLKSATLLPNNLF